MSRLDMSYVRQSVITVLPVSPAAGDEVHLQTAAMAALTPPLTWHLRSDGTKWVVLSGAPLLSTIDAYTAPMSGPDRAVSSTTYVALAVALTVALPVAGWYDIELGCGGYNSSAGQLTAMSYDIGATAASDVDAIGWQAAVINTDVQRVIRSDRKQFTSAVTLTAKFRVAGGTAQLRGPKWMKATPIYLG